MSPRWSERDEDQSPVPLQRLLHPLSGTELAISAVCVGDGDRDPRGCSQGCPRGVPGELRHEPSVCTRSEEHTSELQSLMRISYAVFCLKKKHKQTHNHSHTTH